MNANRRSQTGGIGVGLVVTLAILGVIVAGGLMLYGYAASIQHEGVQWETDLNKSISIEVSERATYETSIMEQVGLSDFKATKIKEIISGAIQGRYGDAGFKGGTFAAAITEAYPGTEGLNIIDKIATNVQSGREAIRNKQNIRIEQAQAYNLWRKDGPVRRRILAWAGYPSQDLSFKMGDKTYYGAEALEKMAQPISTASVNKAFDSGVEQPLKFK